MSRFLYRLGRSAVRHRKAVLLGWILAVVAVGVLASSLGGQTVDKFSIPGTETQHAADLLKARFPAQSGVSTRIVFKANQGAITDAANVQAVDRLLATVKTQPRVVQVGALTTAAKFGLSGDPSVGFATVQYRGQAGDVGKAGIQRIDDAAVSTRKAGVDVAFGGDLANFTANSGPGSSEGIGIGVAVIVLLIAFGSVVAMGLPIGTALISLVGGLMLVKVGTAFIDVSNVAPTVATMIGLGVGIDYALFIVTRHREHLHAGMTVEESAARAIASAGQAVLFAGTTVVIAILGLAFVGIPLVTVMGLAAAVVVAVSVLAALTLLPAFLGFAGHNIDRFKIPFVKGGAGADQHSWAHRWSQHVSHRPWRYMIGAAAILITLTVPFFSIRLGSPDAGNNPKGNTTRIAYDWQAAGFGRGFTGPLQLVVDLGGPHPQAAAQSTLATIAGEARQVPGVAAVATTPGPNTAGNTGLVTVYPATAPQDEATQTLVSRLRHQLAPQAEQATGVPKVMVSGSTAAQIDLGNKVKGGLPVFIGAVLLLSFLLLMVVFRSLVVPLKAAVLNLLGIAAAYGVVVAIFQWGWGKSFFGVAETLPIISFLPMFMFAILFGLSMDYEVFLMSRIREEYVRTRDNLASVGRGIDTTARVITAAAIIMVSVFGSFVLGDNPTIKMMGIGLAVAIFLDATLIRMVLVPATMSLLGRANWWLPGWLDRLLPHLDIEGEGGLPEPAMESGFRPTTPDSGIESEEPAESPFTSVQ